MRCHHCDHQAPAIAACPACHGIRIAFRGIGTERLEQEVQALWPEARLGRLDRDTTGQKGAHHTIIERFRREETDILLGTQMVAKGFDFPKVTLVGVIAADTSLGVPDFRAPERTFQLLTQVAGRAGRGAWAGEVLVQTYQPDHYAIQMAMRHDYDSFYQHEIIKRGDPDACWPPLTAILNIIVSGEAESEVNATAAALARRAREEGAERLAFPPLPANPVLPGLFDLLMADVEPNDGDDDPFGAEELLQRDLPTGITINDATPCPLARLRGRYRYHVVLRAREISALLKIARSLQRFTPPKGVIITFDIDPLSLA